MNVIYFEATNNKYSPHIYFVNTCLQPTYILMYASTMPWIIYSSHIDMVEYCHRDDISHGYGWIDHLFNHTHVWWNMKAWTTSLPFCRWHFLMNFLQWKYLHLILYWIKIFAFDPLLNQNVCIRSIIEWKCIWFIIESKCFYLIPISLNFIPGGFIKSFFTQHYTIKHIMKYTFKISGE